MKEKVLSFIAWIAVWAILLSTYHFLLAPKFSQFPNGWTWNFRWQMMDAKNMSDDQLERTATRVWMTKEELKKEIDSGKDLRTIMQEKWVNFGGRWTRNWSGSWNTNAQ